MKEHPILFNAEMVKALLDGRKTQTRRVIKPQPDTSHWIPAAFDKEKEWRRQPCLGPGHTPENNMWCLYNKDDKPGAIPYTGEICPFGQAGDRLWVKESYWIGNYDTDKLSISGIYLTDEKVFSDVKLSTNEFNKFQSRAFPFRSSPSIFMYKSLSRINLEIVNIRVERVMDITVEDALSEGIEVWVEKHQPNGDKRSIYPTADFAQLWDSINKKRGFGWDINPWVWVVEFKRV